MTNLVLRRLTATGGQLTAAVAAAEAGLRLKEAIPGNIKRMLHYERHSKGRVERYID